MNKQINDKMPFFKKVFGVLAVLDAIALISAVINLLPTFPQKAEFGQPMAGIFGVMFAGMVAIKLFEILGKVSDIDWDFDSNQIESLIVSGSGIQNTLKISNGELVIPFDTVDKIGDKVVLKSAFAEDDGLSNIEKEIQDLKNQL